MQAESVLHMLKLTKIIYTDEFVVPSGYQIQLPCSSREGALFATGALLAKGYLGIADIFPKQEK